MGGLGSGIAYDEADLRRIAGAGLQYSPTTEVLLEESILGWKEYELELMRDRNDNVVVVCSIENVDPMGVHTGDSITVAPALTLTDREYQRLRDIGIDIIREVGVDTGGCNIQFAVDPDDGRVIVIEMNPRVSRSSRAGVARRPASRSRRSPRGSPSATRLDEIPNDITKETPASFEPTLDYVVVKVPRFAFEKFPAADADADDDDEERRRGDGDRPQLHRGPAEGAALAGEARARASTGPARSRRRSRSTPLVEAARRPTDGSPAAGAAGDPRAAPASSAVHEATNIDPWFLDQIVLIDEVARSVRDAGALTPGLLREAKRHGFSDAPDRRAAAHARGRRPRACATRSGSARSTRPSTRAPPSSPRSTPYHYSSYDDETEVAPVRTPQGDHPRVRARTGSARASSSTTRACTRASRCADAGYETIMVNCNPETVSTDYDTSDRLYFEPLTLEDVLEVVHAEQAVRARSSASSSSSAGRPRSAWPPRWRPPASRSSAPPPAAIDLAEERGAFGRVLAEAGLPAPRHGTASSFVEAQEIADDDRLPGARAAELRARRARHGDRLRRADAARTTSAAPREVSPEHPVLVDRFLDDAIEIDVDALYDGDELYLGGDHGAHRGGRDPLRRLGVRAAAGHPRARTTSSGCGESTEAIARGHRRARAAQRPVRARAPACSTCSRPTRAPAAPCRSSRRRPAVPLAKAAARIMLGATIAELRAEGLLPAPRRRRRRCRWTPRSSVKEAVLPFKRFRTADGAVVDTPARPGDALDRRGDGHRHATSRTRSPRRRPRRTAGCRTSGTVFVSVADGDKRAIIFPVKRLVELGFRGPRDRRAPPTSCAATASAATVVRKRSAGTRPGRRADDRRPDHRRRGRHGRQHARAARRRARSTATRSARRRRRWTRPIITTVQELAAAVQAIEAARNEPVRVTSLQEHVAALRSGRAAQDARRNA